MQTITKLITDALHRPNDALRYDLSRWVREMYPDKFILETEDYDFDLKAFAEAGRCSLRLLDDAHPQIEAEWVSREEGASFLARNGFMEANWQGKRLKVLTIRFDDCIRRQYIIGSEPSVVKDFFARVCLFSSEVHGDVLVFANGFWHRSKPLLQQIQSARMDNLVLSEKLRETLRIDIEDFFESKDLYLRQGVAWKRGILMLGPPGNGKTHAIKALVNRLGKPCLYVRSFRAPRGTIHGSIAEVFRRARQAAPCLLVLEDLDTLIDKQNLAFFLNEMDGFASNEGILTLATTNHPEKLDPAILDRPSRFDRKIEFGLPEFPERLEFLRRANEKREPELRLSNDGLNLVTERTEGFSYAYLKELCLSGMMLWMRNCSPGSMADAMLSVLDNLRAQMKTQPLPPPVEVEEVED